MRLKSILLCALLLLLAACASLPENYAREESWKLDASDTQLAQFFDQAIAANPGESGAFPLGDGIEALAARVALARAAEKSLDVQYYIWHGDESGTLLLKELLDAANRGVRVRLLLDDIGVSERNDKVYRLLDAHPNVGVALYNPIASRDARTRGLLSEPLRLNHRMHNKSMTADNTLTIVGGRNIGNEYFSLDDLVNFADMDVLAVGPVASQVSDSFDLFWNSPQAFPISAFHAQAVSAEQVKKAQEKLDERVNESSGPYYQAMASSNFGMDLEQQKLMFFWGKIVVLYDQPEKTSGGGTTEVLLKQLAGVLGKTREDLLIVSPYFVPGEVGAQALVEAVQRGARVRVLTNSLASTDVGAVHAGYKKYRSSLLEGGVELFELKPTRGADQGGSGLSSAPGSSGASLHAKMFLIDNSMVFIGSMNLDPRSVQINTEMGLLIENRNLEHVLEFGIDRILINDTYQVLLEPQNPDKPQGKQRLVWVDRAEGKETRYTTEPDTTFWQRLGVGIIGLLPVDSQL